MLTVATEAVSRHLSTMPSEHALQALCIVLTRGDGFRTRWPASGARTQQKPCNRRFCLKNRQKSEESSKNESKNLGLPASDFDVCYKYYS